MRDKPQRTPRIPRAPRAPRLDWPGGIVPEWAKVPAAGAKRRGKGPRGGKDAGKRERLQKVMAQSGHGSRRNIEILIAQGHLTINGEIAKLGDSVGPGDRVKLDGKLISLRFGTALPRVLLYHKPEGEICTRDDPENRPTVFAKLPKVNNARWVSIGRLDYNTSGLLIFTTNGELANRLMHPRYEVEREYAVRLMGVLSPEQVQLLTQEGIELEGEKCKFDRLVDKGGEGSNHWYHVVLKEGKNREVRRMFEAAGLMVSRLMRVRYGPVELPSHLKRGMMRDLPEEDVAKLMAFTGMTEGEPAEVEDEEADEEYSPGNVAPPGEVLEQDDDFEVVDEDERQPAFLMEGYEEKKAVPDEEVDDDRQPDFDRLPGFNRATGTMGAPAGHRGPRVHGAGAGQGKSFGPGQQKVRGKRRGKVKGGGATPAQHQARVGGGVPAAAQPGQGRGQGHGPGYGQGQGQGRGQGHAPEQGPGQGAAGPQGKGRRKRRGRGKGPGPAPGQGAQAGAQPGQGQQPPALAGTGAPKGPGGPGQGKPGRGRRNRNRNRNRGDQPPAAGGNGDPTPGS